MIDPAVLAKLERLAQQMRELVVGYSGSVTVHFSSRPELKPEIELRLCNVAKKT